MTTERREPSGGNSLSLPPEISREFRRVSAVSRLVGGDPLVIVHDFVSPPYGGGNQFLLGLRRYLLAQGIGVGTNRIGSRAKAILFNSFNFDFAPLRRAPRKRLRMIHRVDGPIAGYRGYDDGTDQRISDINRELADVTIFQSEYSLMAHEERGLELRRPVVIPNAADPEIFHARGRRSFDPSQKVRVVAAAWSDNVRKGADALQWLDGHLDFDRYSVTFVGRIGSFRFRNIEVLAPVTSRQLAEILRDHDVYLAPSMNDPCSNALIEAMACGLPVVFLRSGGHPELVAQGGCGFDAVEEIPAALARLVAGYRRFQGSLSPPRMTHVARLYLEAAAGRLGEARDRG